MSLPIIKGASHFFLLNFYIFTYQSISKAHEHKYIHVVRLHRYTFKVSHWFVHLMMKYYVGLYLHISPYKSYLKRWWYMWNIWKCFLNGEKKNKVSECFKCWKITSSFYHFIGKIFFFATCVTYVFTKYRLIKRYRPNLRNLRLKICTQCSCLSELQRMAPLA